jgi:hypothetical protein
MDDERDLKLEKEGWALQNPGTAEAGWMLEKKKVLKRKRTLRSNPNLRVILCDSDISDLEL